MQARQRRVAIYYEFLRISMGRLTGSSVVGVALRKSSFSLLKNAS
jgi:hypothetical protein